ncbi:MAG: nicotinamide riboside transporter PnuC [Chlamydiales bacterium]|jgi:nicotinamide riboside transporter PnuC
MLQYIDWVFVVLSLIGNVFVIKKNVVGQWIWAISNVGWIGFFLYNGIYSSAVLFSVYLCLCVWGIYSWSKPQESENVSEKKIA